MGEPAQSNSRGAEVKRVLQVGDVISFLNYVGVVQGVDTRGRKTITIKLNKGDSWTVRTKVVELLISKDELDFVVDKLNQSRWSGAWLDGYMQARGYHTTAEHNDIVRALIERAWRGSYYANQV